MHKNQKGFFTIEVLITLVLGSILAYILIPRLLEEDTQSRLSFMEDVAVNLSTAISESHAIWEASKGIGEIEYYGHHIVLNKSGWPCDIDNKTKNSSVMTPVKCRGLLNTTTGKDYRVYEKKQCKGNCDLIVSVENNAVCKFTELKDKHSYVLKYNTNNGLVTIENDITNV